MAQRIGGPGIGLQVPQLLYPPNLTPSGVPFSAGSSDVALPAGTSIQIPAGEFIIDLGKYSILEYQDPTRGPAAGASQLAGAWRPIRTQRGTFQIRSDGTNFRISNLTGTVVGGTITNAGGQVNPYVQATTTITPSTGASTWQPIVGGAIARISASLLNSTAANGSGYTLPPIVFIPAPPAPGVQAEAIANLSSGTIGSFTMINQGAGYPTAPPITILPSPFDPAVGTIVNAQAASELTGAGALTGVIMTNAGGTVATTMTLTVAGAGSSALVTPTFCTTITNASVNAIGSGTFTAAFVSTYGGVPPATPAWTEGGAFIPRQAQILVGLTGANLTPGSTTIVDGGLFLGSVFPIINVYGGTTQTAPTFTLTQGGATDTVMIQPI